MEFDIELGIVTDISRPGKHTVLVQNQAQIQEKCV